MNTFPKGLQKATDKMKVIIHQRTEVEKEVILPIAAKSKYGGYYIRNDKQLMIVREESISLWNMDDKYCADYINEMSVAEVVSVEEVKDAIAATVKKFLSI